MALDTLQKRGSSISVSLPFRVWLSEPDGPTSDSGERLSLVYYSSAQFDALNQECVGTSSGTCSVIGLSVSYGSSDGTSTVNGLSISYIVGSSDGTSTVEGYLEDTAVGTSDGTSTVNGLSISYIVGSSDGTSTVDGSSISSSVGTSSGTSTVEGYLEDTGVGTSSGTCSVIGRSISYVVGTISGTSTSNATFSIHEVGSGSINVSSNDVEIRVNYTFVHEISWNVSSNLQITKKIRWDVGDIPIRIFQIQGACRFPTCADLPIGTDDAQCAGALGKNQFIQTIYATSLAKVCDFLLETGWTWPIASIKKFSNTLDDIIVEDGELPPNCNELSSVEFCDIPECFEFCLHTDGKFDMAMSFSAISNIVRVSGIGGLTLSGTYFKPKTAIGSGGLFLSGSADYLSSYHEYEGSGELIVSGNSDYSLEYYYYPYSGSGELTLYGFSPFVAPNQVYEASGGVVLSGSAEFSIKFSRAGSGLISLGGSTYFVYPYFGKGKITLSGTAGFVTLRICEGDGSLAIGGTSPYISPYHTIIGTGGLIISESSAISNSISYVADGTIILDGEADTRDSLSGNYWFSGIGGVVLGGSSDYGLSQYTYIGSGDLSIYGEADSNWEGDQPFDMEMGFIAEDLEIVFADFAQEASTLIAATSNISKCGCDSIPSILYLNYNLENGNILREFLLRNGLALPEIVSLFYDKRYGSWKNSLHFKGVANNQGEEIWNFVFEWACTDTYAGEDLDSNVWKFSLLITRKNTQADFDTRIVAVFPAEQICYDANLFGLDFDFTLDTKTQFIKIDGNLLVDILTFHDEIGLFSSKYWSKNKLEINIREHRVIEDLEITDINSIIPV